MAGEIDLSAICEECIQLLTEGCPDCEGFQNYIGLEEENMPNNEVAYIKHGDITVSEKTNVVISREFKDGKQIGYYINEFIHAPKYTGPTKGVFIPNEKWNSFKALVIAAD